MPEQNQAELITQSLGVGEVVDNEQSTDQNTTTQATEVRQPTDQQAQKPKINLDELPEFKSYKSEFDRRYESLRQQAAREKAELDQRLAQYEQQLEGLQTKDLDDLGKLRYENEKLRRQHEATQQALYRQQAEQGRFRLLNHISQTMGVPINVIESAENADDAWTKAAVYARSSSAQQQAQQTQQRQQKREANQVDLGGGSVVSTQSDLQAKYDKAMAQFNTSAAIDIMYEADKAGVRLRL